MRDNRKRGTRILFLGRRVEERDERVAGVEDDDEKIVTNSGNK